MTTQSSHNFAHATTAEACAKLKPDWIIRIGIRRNLTFTIFQLWALEPFVKYTGKLNWRCNLWSHINNLALNFYRNISVLEDDVKMNSCILCNYGDVHMSSNFDWMSYLHYMIYVVFSSRWKEQMFFTHWGRVTHICVGNLTIIGSDNGLSPGRRQAIIWTIAGILLIGPLGTNFSEILIGIQTFSFKKMHLKMLSATWRPFCPGLNVLNCMSHWPLCGTWSSPGQLLLKLPSCYAH